jgi:hypothetical protein
MKKCIKCNLEKNESDFAKNHRYKDKLNKVCKTCESERVNLYNKEHRDQINEKIRAKTQKIKLVERFLNNTIESRTRQIVEIKDNAQLQIIAIELKTLIWVLDFIRKL